MIKGFRDFIMRGNVIDLAVAVVIGAAFTALVSSFTTNLVQPIINAIVSRGVNDGTVTIFGIDFGLGAFVTAVITFLVTAAVVYFVFVAPMNAWKKRFGKTKEEEQASEEIVLLREIRDQLVAQSGKDGTP